MRPQINVAEDSVGPNKSVSAEGFSWVVPLLIASAILTLIGFWLRVRRSRRIPAPQPRLRLETIRRDFESGELDWTEAGEELTGLCEALLFDDIGRASRRRHSSGEILAAMEQRCPEVDRPAFREFFGAFDRSRYGRMLAESDSLPFAQVERLLAAQARRSGKGHTRHV